VVSTYTGSVAYKEGRLALLLHSSKEDDTLYLFTTVSKTLSVCLFVCPYL